jgi:hypothetical protein
MCTGGNRSEERQLQGGEDPVVQYRLRYARETAVAKIKTRGKHEHSEQLTEVVGVVAGPNQGCSDGNTTVPSVSALWRQDHGGDPRHLKTTTMPFKL